MILTYIFLNHYDVLISTLLVNSFMTIYVRVDHVGSLVLSSYMTGSWDSVIIT